LQCKLHLQALLVRSHLRPRMPTTGEPIRLDQWSSQPTQTHIRKLHHVRTKARAEIQRRFRYRRDGNITLRFKKMKIAMYSLSSVFLVIIRLGVSQLNNDLIRGVNLCNALDNQCENWLKKYLQLSHFYTHHLQK